MTNERRVLVHPDKVSLAGCGRSPLHHQDARPARRPGGGARRADRRLDGRRGARGGRVLARPRCRSTGRACTSGGATSAGCPRVTRERNDEQSRVALLDDLDLPESNLHPFPTSDSGLTLDEAAVDYAAELADHGVDGLPHPIFDITFLGVGPDGHIASLFPHRSGIQVTDRTVIAVRNSPKPPPERLSLTRPGASTPRSASGSCWRAPTRLRRSVSPSPARAATRCRSPASRAAVARCSSSIRTPQPRCPSRSSRATTDATAELRIRRRGRPIRPPPSVVVSLRRQSFGTWPRRVRSCVSASSSSAAASSSVRRSFTYARCVL